MPIRNLISLALVCTILIGLWVSRYVTLRSSYEEGDRVRVTGRIVNQPQVVDHQQKVRVGDFTFITHRFPELSYGQRIIAEGVVGKSAAGYYLKDPKIEKIGEKSIFASTRQQVLSFYQKQLPEPHSGLLSGIVLGTKSSLDSGFLEALRKTGTLHIVVASGSNIALFSGVLTNLTVFIWGRKRAILFAFVLVWGYVMFIGADPPIVRAAIMGSILFLGQFLGREADSLRALFVAGIVMLLINPLWLFDLGFQLSFLATSGIILLAGRIGKALERFALGKLGIIRIDLATTLAAQIAVTPLLFVTFGEISLISPLVNMLVLWSVPFIMLGGFGLGILALLGSVGEVIGQVLAWFLWLPLEWFVRIVVLFGNL